MSKYSKNKNSRVNNSSKIYMFYGLVMLMLIPSWVSLQSSTESYCLTKTGFATEAVINPDDIIGTWKVVGFEDTNAYKITLFEIAYEFTGDTIISRASVNGELMPEMKVGYIVKDTVLADTLVLEAIHPQSKEKGLFKITFDGDKMKLTDPANTKMTLEKR
ncbi:MAG: hypothetical protein EHM58_14015 [Ignavibacteriae bacterium]|nr:MAG: hypothetical protein EHM58_14015 [Ignavibacteriota bacterium]